MNVNVHLWQGSYTIKKHVSGTSNWVSLTQGDSEVIIFGDDKDLAHFVETKDEKDPSEKTTVG